ncbi:MAG: alpha/beta hydrolase-fold protein [Phycisphaerales bacterium]|nr:alpha/beta hydrolase-fold protein [Phycisphaerales bacterium]
MECTRPRPAMITTSWLAALLVVVLADLLATRGAVAAESAYVDAGRGDVRIVRPSDFDPAEPLPLIMLLHAYAYSGEIEEAYLQLSSQVDAQRFILCLPNGRRNFTGQRYWNATDACCDIFNQSPDDSGYLRGLVDVVGDAYAIDPRRIHLIGHSNGGFMAHRMICEHDGLFAGIATLASATYLNADACTLETPVHVLQVHGTLDVVVLYGGGCFVSGGCYPSAEETQRHVAADNGCGDSPDPRGGSIDLVPGGGAESTVSAYASTCASGGSAELWTVPAAGHNPPFGTRFAEEVVAWLLARPAPMPVPDADLNGDDRVTAADLGILLASWGDCAGCDADFDGNGIVAGLDLGVLLGQWTP